MSFANTPNWSNQPSSGLQINSTAISDDGSVMVAGTSKEYVTSDTFALYCYQTANGSSGKQLWNDAVGQQSYQGIFWVAISRDGAYCAAGGGLAKGSGGFVRAYSVSGGPSSRSQISTGASVQEVELNADGSFGAAVAGPSIYLLQRSGSSFSAPSPVTVPGAYLNSCGISDDGQWIVAGGSGSETAGSRSGGTSATDGVVKLLQNKNGTLTVAATYTLKSGVKRVVITPDGSYFAASCADGTITLYTQQSGPLWTYTPPGVTLAFSYALAIAKTSTGQVLVGSGGNGSSQTQGYAYLVQNVTSGSTSQAKLLWIRNLGFWPNPGMNMDRNGVYMTATDGEPMKSPAAPAPPAAPSKPAGPSLSPFPPSSPPPETSGEFYVFQTSNGQPVIQFKTKVMNWPLVVNGAGSAFFGGSDDGYVYYWGAPASK